LVLLRLSAPIQQAPDRGHQRRTERVLDQGRGEQRRDPDKPCLLDARFMPKAGQPDPAARIDKGISPLKGRDGGV
jgi:hypothetical protein